MQLQYGDHLWIFGTVDKLTRDWGAHLVLSIWYLV